MINQAVIFCGGLGKRLLPITKKLPKPMVVVDNKPFLYHLIKQCKSNGIKNFLLLCGYKKEKIIKYFGNGSKIGVNIKYHFNPTNIQTFQRLIDARKLIKNQFLLMYADNYSSLNIHELSNVYKSLKASFLISVSRKKRGNILIDRRNNKIKKYFFKKNIKAQYVEIGYMIINKKILPKKNSNFFFSLNEFIDNQIRKKKVNYYLNENGYVSISDKKRYLETKKYFKNNIVLIDRDGVLNLKNTFHYYVRNTKELFINKYFIKLYRKHLNKKKIICITNQAGIATGDLTEKNLLLINKEIKKYYKKKGIDIMDFFVSKHHFSSKNIDRKPGHGLFLKAAKKYKFLLDRVIYIGDDIRDIEASYNAKCKCIYLGKKKLNTKQKNKFRYILSK